MLEVEWKHVICYGGFVHMYSWNILVSYLVYRYLSSQKQMSVNFGPPLTSDQSEGATEFHKGTKREDVYLYLI